MMWRWIKSSIAVGLCCMLAFCMEAYGQIEEDAPSLYGIGSTSKVVTAAAVMKLSEEGEISLDDPVVRYIPEFVMADERYRQITVRMLLDHSSGLQGSTLAGAMLLGDPDTGNHDGLLTALQGQRLKAEPGAFAVYCNDGFTLAEILVERVSGMSFTEYIRREFAGPLGLESFATPQTPGILSKAVPVYDAVTGAKLPPEMANVIGSGGIYATASDLCRFSRIFMRDQGNAAGILSGESARMMEESAFQDMVNPDGLDSTLSYGLGWDSVSAYPFSRYGIKALVKGGDTSYYHSSLTVLPEENISCAVVTSGGSSTVDQLAVQEILMEYLEESGRIVREAEELTVKGAEELTAKGAEKLTAKGVEKPAAEAGKDSMSAVEGTVDIPDLYQSYAGLYAGTGMFRVDVREDGTLILESYGTGRDRSQTYVYRDDGRFYSEGGDYISSTGSLAHSSAGRTGKTFLEFKELVDGRRYLMAGIYETYPKLGSTAVYLPVAEQTVPLPAERAVTAAWEEQSGREFYLVSEKYTSAFYLDRFMIKPLTGGETAGYLTFENGSQHMARLTDGRTAEFFQQIPGQVGRDLLDYHLERKDGKTYLQAGSYRYIREDGVLDLEDDGEAVVIGTDGEAVIKRFGKEFYNRLITIEKPSDGAWYIYDHTGKKMKCVASSWLYGSDSTFLLPENGLIIFAGEAGAGFQVTVGGGL